LSISLFPLPELTKTQLNFVTLNLVKSQEDSSDTIFAHFYCHHVTIESVG